jgi:hypothetical protein
MEKKFTIRASLKSDIRTSKIWSSEPITTNLVKIKNKRKSIIVSHRRIDDNFINDYNTSDNTIDISLQDDILILDEYYRKLLGVDKNTTIMLNMIPIKWYYLRSNLLYLLKHPDDSIRIATYLALFSILFDVVPLIRDTFLCLAELWEKLSVCVCD